MKLFRLNDIICFGMFVVLWGCLKQPHLFWANVGVVVYCIVSDIFDNINLRLEE